MLESVDVGERSIDDYHGIVTDELIEELRDAAEDLKGLRILNLNATPYGGGVAELLRSSVPLLNDLGLVSEWKIISGDPEFFQVTKAIHNALQGGHISLTGDKQDLFVEASRRNAALLEEAYDVVFVHDPQPAPIPALRGKGESLWVWRCHIDTSEPDPDTWEFMRRWLSAYDAAVFTMDDFVPPDFPNIPVDIIPPAIDPLSPKNFPLKEEVACQVLGWIGIRLGIPLVTQVSRFDTWKDPLGVIKAYRLAREEIPNLQLALVGSMALDDPEGWGLYEKVRMESESDPFIHIFTNLTGVGNIEVNSFQSVSDVVVQKSTREGFGLVVSEALWKGTPVVGGRSGGISLQMADGVGGYLVDSVEECADSITRLLKDRNHALELSESGKERVRANFLLPRLLLNELTLIKHLTSDRPMICEEWEDWRDPVCGMAVSNLETAPAVEYDNQTYRFCSELCHKRFLFDPQRFIR